jgi:hypothetical protein
MLNPAWVGVDPFQDHQAARRFLFHDCDEATARWAIATQTPWYPEGLYSERCPLAAFPPGSIVLHASFSERRLVHSRSCPVGGRPRHHRRRHQATQHAPGVTANTPHR